MISQPIGYRQFHPNEHFNFQLNRWLPFLPEEDLYRVARVIETFDDWKQAMLQYAKCAESEGRLLHAAFYYRAAEFFMSNSDTDKDIAYSKFLDLFDKSTKHIPYARVNIPYQNGYLPCVVLEAEGEEKDVMLVHGGFDSFMEELFLQFLPIAKQGIKLIFFEGPGQGTPLRKFNMPMPSNWEVPVAAVLDHFKIDSCALMGISLGGYLATRAAAFEPRIKRVIADDVMEDFFDCLSSRTGEAKAKVLRLLLALKMKPLINKMLAAASNKDIVIAWALEQGLKVSGANTIYDYLKWAQTMCTQSFSHRVTQDFLLLAGNTDHLVPLDQFYRQAKTLSNVRSFTGRIFTDKENDAGNHCHIGNTQLATDFIVTWLSLQLK